MQVSLIGLAQLFLALLAIFPMMASAIFIKSNKVQVESIGSDRFLVVKSYFNTWLYYLDKKGKLTRARELTNLYKRGKGDFPLSVSKITDDSWIECGSEKLYGFHLPPTYDPLGTARSLWSGNYYRERGNHNLNVLAYKFSSAAEEEKVSKALADGECSIVFAPHNFEDYSNGYRVSDSRKRQPTSLVAKLGAATDPDCNYYAFSAFRSAFYYALRAGIKRVGYNGSIFYSDDMQAVLTRSSYTACKAKYDQFFNVGSVNMPFKRSKECYHDASSPEWAKDPCCNEELAYTQCCAPRTVSTPVEIVQSVNSDVIKDQCRTDDRIVPYLLEYVNLQSKISKRGTYSMDHYWSAYYRFVDDCQKYIHNRGCRTNSHCYYGGKCVNRKCVVNYGDEVPVFAKCFAHRANGVVRAGLESMFKLNTRRVSSSKRRSNLEKKLRKYFAVSDCSGPRSESFRSKLTYVEDENGQLIPTVVPGNKTGCLAEQQCNQFDPHSGLRLPNGQCSDGNFCAICKGQFCDTISTPAACGSTANYGTKALCEAAGKEWKGWYCDLGFSDEKSCLEPDFCHSVDKTTGDNLNNDPWRCDFSVCYDSNLDKKSCEALQKDRHDVWYSDEYNQCFFDLEKSACEADNRKYWPGRFFVDAKFSSKKDCKEGRCSNPLLQNKVKEPSNSACKKSRYCTSFCPSCESENDYNGLCVDPAKNTSASCLAVRGNEWWSTSGEGLGCVIPRLSRHSSHCTRRKFKYITCSGLSNDKCEAGEGQNLLRCGWNNYAKCKNSRSCYNAGSCDDEEYTNSCELEGCEARGACLIPFKSVSDECEAGQIMTDAGCVDKSLSKAQCEEAGHEWKYRAKTKNECQDGTYVCNDPAFGELSMKNFTECRKCGGYPRRLHTWTPGRWSYGSVEKASWMSRKLESVNKWDKTINWPLWTVTMDKIISAYIDRIQYSRYSHEFGRLFNVVRMISCDCGSTERTCFKPLKTVVAKCSQSSTSSSKCAGFQLKNNSSFSSNGTVNLTVSSGSTAAGASGAKTSSSKSKRSLAGISADAFAVVSYNGQTVGQLVGSGTEYTFTSSVEGTYEICLETNPLIPQDEAKFPTLDFVRQNDDDSLSAPLGLSVSQEGSQYCAELSEPDGGMFFPIRRVADLTQFDVVGSSGNSVSPSFYSMLVAVIVSLALTLF